MKILAVLLLGVTLAEASGFLCTPALIIPDGSDTSVISNLQPIPCVVTIDGAEIDIEDESEENCTSLSKMYNTSCCMYNGKCVATDSGVTVTVSTEDIKRQLHQSASQTVAVAKFNDETGGDLITKRRLLLTLPGIPFSCIPPPVFPASCKPTRNEPFVLKSPVDVPYCVRIPCKAVGNAPLDKDLKLCGSQPGCYFDNELHEYREAFGPSVLPGVPVCQLAIRSKFFQRKSLEVKGKYGSWNPYFTNCLLTTYEKEIREGPKGCELLPILDAFYVTPKMAGWKNINSYECALIDGCWRSGRGCFYPVDISKVRVKSGQHEITFKKNEIVYGRPRCQVFDASSPVNIMKSFHRCLSSGCTVDSSVTSLYYTHLFTIGGGLTPSNHWKFWSAVEKGHIGPHNIESVLPEYGAYTPLPPQSNDKFPIPPVSPPIQSGGFPFPMPEGNSSCGLPFRLSGGRPCKPPRFPSLRPKAYCPYKPFHVPRFPKLTGRFDGCCDINLCYLPKSEISQMHSGPSLYYTEWSRFTECSASCGSGEMRRYRKCISDDQSLCTGKLMDVKPCQVRACSSWTNWGPFSPCPRSCFPGGVQTRKRSCYPPGGRCDGSAEDTRDCNTHQCRRVRPTTRYTTKRYVPTPRTGDPFGFDSFFG